MSVMVQKDVYVYGVGRSIMEINVHNGVILEFPEDFRVSSGDIVGIWVYYSVCDGDWGIRAGADVKPALIDEKDFTITCIWF